MNVYINNYPLFIAVINAFSFLIRTYTSSFLIIAVFQNLFLVILFVVRTKDFDEPKRNYRSMVIEFISVFQSS